MRIARVARCLFHGACLTIFEDEELECVETAHVLCLLSYIAVIALLGDVGPLFRLQDILDTFSIERP